MHNARIGTVVGILALMVTACGGADPERDVGGSSLPGRTTVGGSGSGSATGASDSSKGTSGGAAVTPTVPVGAPTTPPPKTPTPTVPAPPQVVPIACATPQDVVTAAFFIALARKPDAGGLDFWVTQLQSGQGRLDVLKSIVSGNEFVDSRAGLSNEQFVVGIYGSFLNRAPDADGEKFWLDQMAAGYPRASVALAIVDGSEFQDPLKNRAFKCFF
jgi:hypothetical protein